MRVGLLSAQRRFMCPYSIDTMALAVALNIRESNQHQFIVYSYSYRLRVR